MDKPAGIRSQVNEFREPAVKIAVYCSTARVRQLTDNGAPDGDLKHAYEEDDPTPPPPGSIAPAHGGPDGHQLMGHQAARPRQHAPRELIPRKKVTPRQNRTVTHCVISNL